MTDNAETVYQAVTRFDRLQVFDEEAGKQLLLVFEGIGGSASLLKIPLQVAAEVHALIGSALAAEAKAGRPVKLNQPPERILRYNAAPGIFDDQQAVMVLLDGDASPQPFFGVMKPDDAKSLGAVLMQAATSGGKSGPTN